MTASIRTRLRQSRRNYCRARCGETRTAGSGGRPRGKGPVEAVTSPRGRPYIPMFSVLCNQIDDLTGVAVTADAMHCQKAHADYLVLEPGRRLHPDGEEQPARAAHSGAFPGKRSRPGTPPSTAAIDEWSNAPTKSSPSQVESRSRTECRPSRSSASHARSRA
jgi:hypothetical protein